VNVGVTVTRSSGTGTPSGDVSLLSNLAPAGAATTLFTLSGGTVSGSTHNLPGGNYTVTAHYAGDGTFGSSDSAPVSVTVSPEASTATLSIFGFDPNGNLIPFTNQTYGSPAYLRADVSGASGFGIPTGGVRFNGSTLSDLWQLDSEGTATTSQGVFNLPGGTHAIVANYIGDLGFDSSNSTPVSITVNPAPTTIALSSNTNSAGDGVEVFLNATISTKSYGSHPSGTVTFFSNGTAIGSSPGPVTGDDGAGNIQTGVYQVALASAAIGIVLPDGQDSITAQYSGDGNYSASISSAVVVNVQADFTPSLSTTQVAIAKGGTGTTTLTITGQSGYSGTINFTSASCTGLPAESSCSFVPPSITGTGTTQVTITTTAAHAEPVRLSSKSGGSPWWLAVETPALAGILLLGLPSKRRRWTRLLCFAVFALLVTLPACGGGSSGGGGGGGSTDPGTPKGSRTVTITSVSSNTVSHPISLALTVN
jgi:hypothetical protein